MDYSTRTTPLDGFVCSLKRDLFTLDVLYEDRERLFRI